MPSNTLAILLLLPLVGLRVDLMAKRRPSTPALVGGAIVAVAFIQTYSRNGLVCLFVAEAVLLVLSGKRRSRVMWTEAIGLSIIAIGLLVVAQGAGGQNLFEAYTRGNGFLNLSGPVDATGSQALELSVGERQFLWTSGLRVFGSHALLGTGFGPDWARIPTREHYGEDFIRGAHNSYITMLAIGGVVGFGCLGAFLGPTVVAAIRRARSQAASIVETADARAVLSAATWLIVTLFAFVLDDIFFVNLPFTILWMLTALVTVNPRMVSSRKVIARSAR
jgi:O-antigen ligase